MQVKTLSEKLLFTTAKIETLNSRGERGSGTGFIFLDERNKDNIKHFMVTNKHVVKDTVKGVITFVESDGLTPIFGQTVSITMDGFEKFWFGHPQDSIDIAIASFNEIENPITEQLKKKIFKTYVSSNSIPNKNGINSIDALEDIVFIGYPNGLKDTFNHTPIIRKGTTATPYVLDYCGEKKFLIDASVFGGSSGSPVFILNIGSHTSKLKPNDLMLGDRLFFLGVVAAVHHRNTTGEIVSIPIPTNSSRDIILGKEMIDLGIVYKPETILETIDKYF